MIVHYHLAVLWQWIQMRVTPEWGVCACVSVYDVAICVNCLKLNFICASFPGVSFNSVYTQIWRVLLHLAADPFPEVSDLAMKVLNSIAYKVCCAHVWVSEATWPYFSLYHLCMSALCTNVLGGAQELLLEPLSGCFALLVVAYNV